MSVILCTAGYDHTIRFWEALSGICSRTIQHPESQVNRLCITPDKRYLAAAGRHFVRLYDIKSSNPNPVMTFEGHTNNITGVAFHCEGKWMVTSSEDNTVKVWDTRSGSLQRNYVHSHPVNDVVIHPNQGELVSADRGGNVRVWDLGESRCTHQLIPEEDVSVASGNVYIWRMYQNREATTLIPVTTFQAHKDYLTRLLLSPDVKHLATCSADHTVKIWSLDPNHETLVSEEQQRAMTAGLPNGVAAMSLEAREFRSSGPVSSKRDDQTTQIGGVKKELDNKDEHKDIEIKEKAQPSMAAQTSALPLETTLTNHQRWVWDCAFSADSAYLVTVCSDHYARLWELSTSQIIRQYNGHHRGAVCVALNDYSEPR